MKKIGYIILISAISAFVGAITYAAFTKLNEEIYHPYDVNRDGIVSAVDYVLIKNHIMSK